MAGVAGVDPGPLTLRELFWMAEGRSRDAWNRTSLLCALIANAHRNPKKGSAFKPANFHPYAAKQKEGLRITADNITVLKDVFVRNSEKRGES